MKTFLLRIVLMISLPSVNMALAEQTYQQKIDSLHTLLKTTSDQSERCMLLNNISNRYYLYNSQKGIKYARQALNLANEINFSKGRAFAYLNLAKNTSMTGDYDQSLIYYSIARSGFEKLNDQKSVGLVCLNQGTIYGNQGKFPEALDSFFKALTLFEQFKDNESKIYQANAYQNIGNIFNFMEENESALKNYERAISLFKQFPDQHENYVMNVALKGTIYSKQKKFQKAISSYHFAENELRKVGDSVSLAFVQNLKGKAYLGLKKYDFSIACSMKALPTAKRSGDQELLASTYQNLGVSYLEKGKINNQKQDFETARNYLNEALGIHLKTRNHEELTNDYALLATYFSLIKQFEKSFEMQQISATYKDSIYNFKNKQSIQNLEDQRTIALRDKQIEINKIALNTREKERWFYGIGVLFLFLIIALFYIQNRQRKRVNQHLLELNLKLQEANANKTRFFSIINHDLRSPVANLIHFLQLQKESPELFDKATKQRLEHKTMEGAENLLQSMEDMLLWSKGQMQQFKPSIEELKIRDLFAELEIYFVSNSEVKLVVDKTNNILLSADRNYLLTILRNLTSNAIKALEKVKDPMIQWSVAETINSTILVIEDNGPGAAKSQFKALYDASEVVGIKTGLGLHLIRDLAQAIDCKVEVSTEQSSGTTISLIFNKSTRSSI
ncbi:tetratricopeptide repeat-containing sensor histidine kinase [Fluviicola taffensis]|uniref:tetratricopeptide repeat-containing sensor histidine kinase n=1 Tax=Fluviicola taffensis TaxID=191579 RepID=UPI003137E4A4